MSKCPSATHLWFRSLSLNSRLYKQPSPWCLSGISLQMCSKLNSHCFPKLGVMPTASLSPQPGAGSHPCHLPSPPAHSHWSLQPSGSTVGQRTAHCFLRRLKGRALSGDAGNACFHHAFGVLFSGLSAGKGRPDHPCKAMDRSPCSKYFESRADCLLCSDSSLPSGIQTTQ